MRVVFLLVFLLAWPGGITSNPLPDVDAGEPEGSGLSTSQTSAGVVGQTLEVYRDEHQGSTGAYARGEGDGVVAGRNRRLSSSDEESGDVPVPKAVVDTKSFEVSSGNDAEVNILAGSKVVIKIHPEPFLSIEERSSQSNKLKMDLICGEQPQGDVATFGFHRDDVRLNAKMYVGSSSFALKAQKENAFFDFIFENAKVTSSKIDSEFGGSPVSFTAPKCWKNSDGKDVWRAKFSTADSRVKFKVEIENAVLNSGSVTAVGRDSVANTSKAGFGEWPPWVWAVIGVGGCVFVGVIIVLLVCCCFCKEKCAKLRAGEKGGVKKDGVPESDIVENDLSKLSQKNGSKSKKRRGTPDEHGLVKVSTRKFRPVEQNGYCYLAELQQSKIEQPGVKEG